MNEARTYIDKLFNQKGISIGKNRLATFEKFVADANNLQVIKQILENEKALMGKWQLETRINDIIQQQVSIPNGTVGKPYEAKLDFRKLGWNDIMLTHFEGLENTGLDYDNETETIAGTPTQSGDLKIKLKFRIKGELESSELNEKLIPLIINPNPRSLWKTINSDRDAPYWKEDNVAEAGKLGDKSIIVASKRGRSHANAGTFRDDDYLFKHLADFGWSVVAVADGAGSASFSRKGSELACGAIIDYFSQKFTPELVKELDQAIGDHKQGLEEGTKKLNHFIAEVISKAPLSASQAITDFSKQENASSKEFYSTLIFALIKKFEFGYAIISFGVGDCPIALINKDMSEVTLMNWLDVGEFGGGTRFINGSDIFSSDKFYTRFKFKIIEDFSYLFLMTDGIYDPKFVVEANLEKIEKWQAFIADLQGKNEEGAKVDFDAEKKEAADQLSKWMDFWSPGNHDDRTLAIIF